MGVQLNIKSEDAYRMASRLAELTGESLTTYWGVKGKAYGRTVYKLVRPYDQVEVVDAILDKKGVWREFSRNTLTKME